VSLTRTSVAAARPGLFTSGAASDVVATAARRLLADHRGSAAPSLRSPQSGPVPLCLACATPAARCLCEASVRLQEPDEPGACEVGSDFMLAK